jgi:hypothetical protein
MGKMPAPVRLMNGLGRAAARVGLQPVKLDADGLLARAQKNTGFSDFGGDKFRQPFHLLLEGLEREAHLTTMGRVVARADILRVLENRLGMVELFKQYPEILEQPVERPLFVVGPPRTGTTIFHDLLALDADNRVPLAWETSYPLPPPETVSYQTDARIAKVQADLERVDQLIPEFKKMHPMGAQRAQECVSITSHDFQSMIFDTQFRVPAYQDAVLASDMRSALQWHRRFLQVLQWKAPAERWVLKTPQHLWHLDYLLREYPDARIVQTHRDPVRVLISLSSLIATLRSLASDQVELAEIARSYAHWLAQGYERTIAFRQSGRLPPSQVVDLYFKDFIGDQLGTVRRAYEHFDIPFSDTTAAKMQSFLDDNPADKHGKHLYSFTDIGMDEAQLRELFRPYQEYFNIPSEPLE